MPGRKRKGETTTNQTEPPQKKGAAVAPSSPEQNGPSVLHTDSVGTLTLETGHKVTGYSFGADKSMGGELVFNTGMVGYPESLTDPSYSGQILVFTFPLIGNYGVPSYEEDEFGILKFFESTKIHVAGVIIQDYSKVPSHWNSIKTLGDWLKEWGVPALYGVDTRMLTKRIREHGSMLAKIEFPGQEIPFYNPNLENLVEKVSRKEPKKYNPTGTPVILAYDCGMKNNIIREFLKRGVCLWVVPFDFDIDSAHGQFDGVFVSNGPGDPVMAEKTTKNIQKVLGFTDKYPDSPVAKQSKETPIPFFGICLGNQLLALALGAKTYKMKYGNRGANQPCVDLRTTKCYVTSQNHGYAVDDKSLPEGWKTFFVNANDESNEGIIHTWAPYLSVQFHPEACAGPKDTTFLFDEFLEFVTKKRSSHTLVPPVMYQVQTHRKCILVGSGGLSIGQAGEFDYSGSQAIKALKEEGIEVILINPNIATVQTSSDFADKVYLLPVTPEMVRSVIEKERPDSILVSMGGQTALNVGVSLYKDGTLEKYGVKVLGTPIPTIINTEDRQLFAGKLDEIGESLAKSISANSIEEAMAASEIIGFPLLVRAAFALGGLGSGFANDKEELLELATKAFASSSQIILDEDLRGWKEVEYEVVRDAKDNCVTVCNMENFDPLGIHTGDSIVIAPSQTLSNEEYFKLREVAVKVVRHLGIVGECNIQYALCPHSERYCIIEVNARLSRSSALASKATGYPLAYVAAKLALGKDLVLVRNSVTQTTTACFEPALDYCVAKVPRWDLKKFQRVSNKLGSSMKSIGEVMAIGRNFEEVIQKAVRMVDPTMSGWDATPLGRKDQGTLPDLETLLKNPTPLRLFALAKAFEMDYSVDKLHSLTRIDRWFLSKLKLIHDTKVAIKNQGSLYKIDVTQMRLLKSRGFSDQGIAKLTNTDEISVRRRRVHDLKVVPFVKQIDTLAAEFPAKTNYLYTTYNATESDLEGMDPGVIVLGNGPYCIGSSVEFDWCAVSCVRTLRKHKFPAVVVNCNPETVSTDYDESDRLYFEELTFERVMDIYDMEKAQGVIVSVGGQVANCMVMPLSKQGVRIFGTSPASIDCAEDRNKFSALLDSIGVDQPEWCQAPDWQGADKFAQRVGYPVLVRPSYVLSGAAMRVAWNSVELREFLVNAAEVSDKYPVVVSKFIQGAKEVEFDAVAQGGQIVNYAISEHVENAGVHSGDATLVLPAQKLYVETIRRVTRIAGNIADALNITGPFNIQFICKANSVKVIECNLRASRSFPFASKTLQCNFIDLATRAMMDLPVRASNIKLLDLDYVGVKAPMFSFTRLQGADPVLGVEMASTGEVACFGKDVHEAFLLSIMSAGVKIPPPNNKTVLFAVGPPEVKISLAPYAKVLQYLGYTLYGTQGTAEYFEKCGIKISSVAQPGKSISECCTEKFSNKEIALVINIPDSKNKSDVTTGYKIRRASVDFGVSLITNAPFAIRLIDALASIREIPCMDIKEIYELGEATSSFNKSTVNLLRKEASSHGGSVLLSTSSDGRKIDSLLTQAQIDVSVSQTGLEISGGVNPL